MFRRFIGSGGFLRPAPLRAPPCCLVGLFNKFSIDSSIFEHWVEVSIFVLFRRLLFQGINAAVDLLAVTVAEVNKIGEGFSNCFAFEFCPVAGCHLKGDFVTEMDFVKVFNIAVSAFGQFIHRAGGLVTGGFVAFRHERICKVNGIQPIFAETHQFFCDVRPGFSKVTVPVAIKIHCILSVLPYEFDVAACAHFVCSCVRRDFVSLATYT
jgi:hypothetical protein